MNLRQAMSGISWPSLTTTPEKVTIAFLWTVYSTHIFKNITVSAEQYSQTKQAFYVVFGECFKVMSDFAGELPEDKACDLFSAFAQESNAYMDSLIERKLF